MAILGSLCGVLVLVVGSLVLWRALRFKGRRLHFKCSNCNATETHFERQVDVRALVNPKCRCGGIQTFSIEGTDTTGDVETFGRNPAEGGSLVVCSCGNRGIVPGASHVVTYSSHGGQTQSHETPVACPRCGVVYVMVRAGGAPSTQDEPRGGCACGVAPSAMRRGMVLRCPQCQQRQARVVLMS